MFYMVDCLVPMTGLNPVEVYRKESFNLSYLKKKSIFREIIKSDKKKKVIYQQLFYFGTKKSKNTYMFYLLNTVSRLWISPFMNKIPEPVRKVWF